MTGELTAPAFSLAGVVLGGLLTAFTQSATQRSAERTEERRQAAATAEARRAEQLLAIQRFLECPQEAERAAYRRPEPWGDDEDGWMTRTGETMTADRNVVLLCAPAVEGVARAYGHALNQAVWRETGDTEVNEHVEECKQAFMTAARAGLNSR